MNHRLISSAEKIANRKGRNRRNSARQGRQRREKMLRHLSLALGASGFIPLARPAECLELLTAHQNRANAIAGRVKRMAATARSPGFREPAESKAAALQEPERPQRVLCVKNRAAVFPRLLRIPHPAGPDLPFVEAVEEATRIQQGGAFPHSILDFFVRATGLPWESSARLLFERGIIPFPFSNADLQAIKASRFFWDRYDEGRTCYRALAQSGQVPSGAGDWAYFDSSGLDELLPGVHVPKRLRRPEYLANLVNNKAELCMDVYSFQMLPLFRHPF